MILLIRCVIVGFAFTVAVFHARLAPGVRAFGRRLVAAVFLVFGVSQFQLLVLELLANPGPPTPPLIP